METRSWAPHLVQLVSLEEEEGHTERMPFDDGGRDGGDTVVSQEMPMIADTPSEAT